MVTSQFSEGISEVLDILKHMDLEYTEKIPDDFMTFLEQNKSTTYFPKLDHSKTLEEMELKDETRKLLSVIYLNYWSNQEQKDRFRQKLLENERAYQKELRKKYSPDELFKNESELEQEESYFPTSIEEKEGIISRIVSFIKNIFNK